MAEANSALTESESSMLDSVASADGEADALQIFMEPMHDGQTSVSLSAQTARYLCGAADDSQIDYDVLTNELIRILNVEELAYITIRDTDSYGTQLVGAACPEPLLAEPTSESLMYRNEMSEAPTMVETQGNSRQESATNNAELRLVESDDGSLALQYNIQPAGASCKSQPATESALTHNAPELETANLNSAVWDSKPSSTQGAQGAAGRPRNGHSVNGIGSRGRPTATCSEVATSECKFPRCRVLEHEAAAHARCHLRSLEFRCERCEFAATTWRRIKKHLALDHFDAQLAAFCAACREYFLVDSAAGRAFIAQHARTCRVVPPDASRSGQTPRTVAKQSNGSGSGSGAGADEEVVTIDLPPCTDAFRCRFAFCEFHERGFTSLGEKSTHEACHHPDEQPRPLDSLTPRYRCPHCSSAAFSTAVWNVMRNHLWERHALELGPLLRCIVCPFKCVFSEQLRVHLKAQHGRSVRVRTRTATPTPTPVDSAAKPVFEFNVPAVPRASAQPRPVAVQFSSRPSDNDADATRRYCCSWSGCWNSVPLRALATRTERDLHERCHATSSHVRLFRCALCHSANASLASCVPTGNWPTIRAHLVDIHGLVFIDADTPAADRRPPIKRTRLTSPTSGTPMERVNVLSRPIVSDTDADLRRLAVHLPPNVTLKKLCVPVRDVLRNGWKHLCDQRGVRLVLGESFQRAAVLTRSSAVYDFDTESNAAPRVEPASDHSDSRSECDSAVLDAIDDEDAVLQPHDESQTLTIAVNDEQDGEAFEDEPIQPPTGLHCSMASDCPFASEGELCFIDASERDAHERCHQQPRPVAATPRSPLCTVSFRCDQAVCSFVCRYWRTLKCHLFLTHRLSIGALDCRSCSPDTELRFFSNLKYRQHIKSSEHAAATHGPGAPHCTRPTCLTTRIVNHSELRVHAACHRVNSSAFHCCQPHCTFSCAQWQRLRWHLNATHGVQVGRFYQCTLCSHRAHNRASLRFHTCSAPARPTPQLAAQCSVDGQFDESEPENSDCELQPQQVQNALLCSVKDCYHHKNPLHDEDELRTHEKCHNDACHKSGSAFTCCFEANNVPNDSDNPQKSARCAFECRNWQRMRTHLLNDHRMPTGRLFDCAEQGCSARFLDMRALEKHLATRHSKHERKLYCKYAQCAYNTLRYSLKHAEEVAHHERSHDLYLAAHVQSQTTSLSDAEHDLHNGDAPTRRSTDACPHFRCLHCQHDEAQWYQAVAHMWTTHSFDAGLYRCDAAGCTFRTLRRREMFDHANVHAGRQFACSLGCGRTFLLQRQARAHASRFCTLIAAQMVDGRVPECATCHRGFKTRALLRHHQRTVHGDDAKRFTCEKCGAVIKHRQNYRAHLRSHDVSKYRKCDYCEYRTPKIALLTAHVQRKHTGCRFLCGYCEQGAYATPYDLKQHLIRKHPGQNVVLKCPSCSYSNVLETNLSNHIRLQHPDLFLQLNIPLAGTGTLPVASPVSMPIATQSSTSNGFPDY